MAQKDEFKIDISHCAVMPLKFTGLTTLAAESGSHWHFNTWHVRPYMNHYWSLRQFHTRTVFYTSFTSQEYHFFSGIMKWWAVEWKGRKVTRYQRPVCIYYFKVKTVQIGRGKGSVKAVSAEEFKIIHIFLGKNPQHFHLVRVVLC